MQLTSIYRTYRPESWTEVIGQEAIVRTLESELKNNAVAHAFLFTGPRGVGKTTSARLVARALNCEQRKKGAADPCGSCVSCTAALAGKDLDIIEIDAASNTGVDHVRENIIAASRIVPTARMNKIFIIDEVHMLSMSAFNALLKTLEEPPANVYFILATTEIHKVPETIISRCQRFDFRRVGIEAIVERLAMIAKKEKVTVENDVLRDIARYATGGMRDAESMLGQLLSLSKKKITREDAALVLPKGDHTRARAVLEQCIAHDAAAAIATLHDAIDVGADPATVAQDMIDLLRHSLLTAVSGKQDDEAVPASHETLIELLERFLAAGRRIGIVEPPQLPLEIAIVEYCIKGSSASMGGTAATHNEEVLPRAQRDEPKRHDAQSEKINTPVTPVAAATTTAAPAGVTGVLPTLEVIRQKWSELLLAAKRYNHSLALIFKVAEPVAVEENRIILGFTHSFHVDRLRDHANQDIACRVFEEVYGGSVQCVQGEVRSASSLRGGAANAEPTRQSRASSPDPLMSSILDTFGGTVVQQEG